MIEVLLPVNTKPELEELVEKIEEVARGEKYVILDDVRRYLQRRREEMR
jgi:hypothetical protein